jgi:carbonic anhydrase
MHGRTIVLIAASALALAAAATAAEWTYTGPAGPAHWGKVDAASKTCAIGTEQSPIDLAGRSVPAPADKFAIDWKAGAFKVVNNGHTIEVEAPAGSTVTLDGVSYALKQFHFHLPSEHTRDGKHAAMEVHFVHQDAKGKAVVVGVMMVAGAASPAFHTVMAAAPAKADGPEQEVTLDPAAFLPKKKARLRYEGSLTTPPCSEVVDWQVMETPITVAAADIDQFRTIIGQNARPVEPRGRRFVLKIAG